MLIVAPLVADDFGFRFGLKATPNISWFRTETRGYENNGISMGYSYGLIVDYDFAEYYAISTGLNILRTGGKLKYDWLHDGFPTTKQSTYRFRHLEVPVALKLRTSEIGYMTYYGLFGVGLAFRTSAVADDRINLPNDQYLREDNVDITDETRFIRAGLHLGAGAEYNFGGRTSLLFGLTFHNGFSNVLNKEKYAVQNKPSANNNYLELTIGVLF